jgi:hypothetical protein
MIKESSMELWHMVNHVRNGDWSVLMRWYPHGLFHPMKDKMFRMLFRLGRPHTS